MLYPKGYTPSFHVFLNPPFRICIPDEDITCSDTTTLATFDSQVKQFFIMIVFDTFDELMMHHDVCSLSFLEIHTWIKRVLKTHGRHKGPKKLIGGQIQVFPTFSTRTPHDVD